MEEVAAKIRSLRETAQIPINNPQLKQFIDMCFDPNSPMNERLKQTLLDMMALKSGGDTSG